MHKKNTMVAYINCLKLPICNSNKTIIYQQRHKIACSHVYMLVATPESKDMWPQVKLSILCHLNIINKHNPDCKKSNYLCKRLVSLDITSA